MERHLEEILYPLSFRKNDAQVLGLHIKNRHSVVLVGMKRVGISNFLRFFLYRDKVREKYINDKKNHLFIPIDLNDLVERELYPFWVLTLKRIEDAIKASPDISAESKKYIETLFLDSIQSQDLFLTIDSIRKSLSHLVEKDFVPTLFFLRFDRVKDVATPEFFANLQGLVDASHQNLSYVFTSVRNLDALSPTVFTKASVSAFARTMYINPSEKTDAKVIFEEMCKKYDLKFDENLQKKVVELAGGYTQYLQFILAFLHDNKSAKNSEELVDKLLQDERILFQSEELWESLNDEERATLISFNQGKKITPDQKEASSYLWNTGLITKESIFSPLFQKYVEEKGKLKSDAKNKELSKKENLLLKLLEKNRGALCEREIIIENVWPEAESYGVSDWAVDRLVARLRQKLKTLKPDYEIVTVKTRGYKLL